MEKKPLRIRSPLKWAGGKYRLLADIESMLPMGNRLLEPFVGSGSVFLNLPFKRYTINDKNQDLVNFYRILKREKKAFIDYCRGLFKPQYNTNGAYYKYRNEFNNTDDKRDKAALFLYLNRHGYNGLCRYNCTGQMNVPFGRHKKPYFPEQEMTYFLKKSSMIKIQSVDFATLMRAAKPGNVIYCDPPYVPLSSTASFTHYYANGFGKTDQIRLSEIAQEVCDAGVSVLISNHNTAFTKHLYKHATVRKNISTRRSINCNGAKRQNLVSELLVLYRPKTKG